jgi:hypothetical protein
LYIMICVLAFSLNNALARTWYGSTSGYDVDDSFD